MSIRRKTNTSNHLFDLTGASDIIFTLLIFYILTQNFMPSLNLTLPEIKHSMAKPKKAIVVILEKDGNIALNQANISLNNFKKRVFDLVKTNGASTTINILADEQAPAGNVVKVLDILQEINALNVTFQGKQPVIKK